MLFKDFRQYISVIDRVSICDKTTLNYSNYATILDVPKDYDNKYLYGIGKINSEFRNQDGTIEFKDCIEIMLSDINERNE